MASASELREIADLARVLYTGYFETAARLTQEQETLSAIRKTPALKEHEAEALEACVNSSKSCNQWQSDLARLAQLTAKNLPELWKKLRIVGHGGHWHQPGFDWDKAIEELRSIEAAATGAVEHLSETEPPKRYLTNWREILIALGMKNNNEDREKVRNFNTQYAGPILVPKQGAQPKADKAKLIEWWNNLEYVWEVGFNSERDSEPTVSSQYKFGKDGTVVPAIGGEVKRRRKDRKP